MKLYKCHKFVKAARIKDVLHEQGGYKRLVFDEGTDRVLPHSWWQKYDPKPGQYLVEYADGYMSVSPAHVFEAGYEHVPDGMGRNEYNELMAATILACRLADHAKEDETVESFGRYADGPMGLVWVSAKFDRDRSEAAPMEPDTDD